MDAILSTHDMLNALVLLSIDRSISAAHQVGKGVLTLAAFSMDYVRVGL
jgi:hypothetical protein